MNRKAIIFSISLVFIALGSLIMLFVIINNLEKQIAPVRGIGGRALEILSANEEAQRLLFYIDESAKLSAKSAFERLKETAGIADKNCGTINDDSKEYVLWNSKDSSCLDADFYAVFQQFFNSKMNKFLRLLKKNDGVELTFNNYELLVDDGKKLFGVAVRPVLFQLIAPQESEYSFWEMTPVALFFDFGTMPQNVAGEFAIRPSFTIQFAHDFSSLNSLKKFAHDILDDVNGCNNKIDSEILECVKGFVQQRNIQLNADVKRVNNNLFLFDIAGSFPVRFALYLNVGSVVEPAQDIVQV